MVTKRKILISMAALLVMACGCQKKEKKQMLYIGNDIAIAETQYGKIQGYIYDDIYHFLGVPYGDDTSGENRFMPPKPPESWDGILRTITFGDSSPQDLPSYDPDELGTFRDHWNYGNVSEDCLKLNVWTPGLDDRKRPVIVWLHGGGFQSGNAVEHDGYQGANFARKQDAVFCSINHRLNCFGYCDLAGVGGEKYKHSGNAGMLDIIAALQWIHDNISNFGGDPSCVTIIGQSGGGAKVCTVAAMPAAKGLVHRGVALSGNITGGTLKETAESLGAAILAEAGLEPSEIDKLQQMPWREFYDIAYRAYKKFPRPENMNGRRFSFMAVGDDVDVPSADFFTTGRTDVPDIPMIFSSVANEGVNNALAPELETMTREDVINEIRVTHQENAEAVFDEYARLFPEESPYGIYSVYKVSKDRNAVLTMADHKSCQESPVYVDWFTWSPDLFDGRIRSFHTIDICFWFNNTDLMWTHTGGSEEARILSDKMSASLAAFMRTGNPNTGKRNGLPYWGEYTPEKEETMVIDNKSEFGSAPDARVRTLMGL